MKPIMKLFVFLLLVQSAVAQKINTDPILQSIAAEKNDSRRINLIFDYFAVTQDTDPLLDMQHAKQLLEQSDELNDPIQEALAISEIGYAYRAIGNNLNGLEYNIKALAIAEQTENIELIAAIKLGMALYYKDLADHTKTLELLHATEALSLKAKNKRILTWAYMNMGEVYISMNKTDSALMYSQRAYEQTNQNGYADLLSYICLQLGKVHGKMGKGTLAISYYDLAITEAKKLGSPKYLNQAYFALAQYYQGIQQKDSGMTYARKAIDATNNTSFSNMCIGPAKFLSDIYDNKNSDSTVKFLKMYLTARDSLFNTKAIQQGQALSFENELRQQEKASEKEQEAATRRQHMQYALLAVGIVGFFILFLVLSRRHITNPKIIELLGVVGLLLVFEFLNLLLHPFLENITHHSPVMMLLALVCIAAILVPLHHKAEKWATAKMVEKNKQIRLAAAKKTIEKLEGQNPEKDNYLTD